MDGIIRILYSFKFTVFGINIDSGNLIGTVESLTNFSNVQGINIWSIGKTVNDVIVPIALSLLILFFMINLIKKSMEVERMSWERVVMAFVSFLLLKYFIQNGYDFLVAIMNITNDIFVSVTEAISNTNTTINIADVLINAVPDGFVDSIMTYGLYLILFIPFMTTIVQILTQIFLRVIKLILCFAFSPIPIALAADDEGRWCLLPSLPEIPRHADARTDGTDSVSERADCGNEPGSGESPSGRLAISLPRCG